MNTSERGRWGETLACEYLAKNGYTVLARNYRIGHEELDIIAENEKYIVFVEVKARCGDKESLYRRPASAVTAKKRAHLAHAAEQYIKSNKSEKFYRCDVIEIYLDEDGTTLRSLDHIKGAFGAKGRIRF